MRIAFSRRPLAAWSALTALWAAVGMAGPPPPPPAPAEAKTLPGLLEPYSGFDVVFGPAGPRVLGPEANPQIEAMLFGPGKALGGATACELGNVRVEASRLLVEVQCPEEAKVTLELQVRDRGLAADKGQGSTWFAIAWPPAWQGGAEGPAQERHRAAQADLLQRVLAKEGLLTWQRVRPAPGSPGDGWMTALLAANGCSAWGMRVGCAMSSPRRTVGHGTLWIHAPWSSSAKPCRSFHPWQTLHSRCKAWAVAPSPWQAHPRSKRTTSPRWHVAR